MKKDIKVGLALGAGAARGLTHIGVLEVLEEHGVHIDFVAGCSMGAVIGCMFASGTPAREIHSVVSDSLGKGAWKLFDITLPRIGLIKGNNIDTLITKLTGDRNIEEMKIPFVTVSACLENGELKVFDSGKATDAVRASISLPGVFEPVILDNKTYVDGGILVRTPVNVVRKMGAEIVIAVDVGYRGELRSSPKNIIDMMIYSFELQQWEAMRSVETDADITVVVNTDNIGPTEFAKVEESVGIGRAAALSVIDDIKNLIDGKSPAFLAKMKKMIFKK